ncbi:glycoside hydrolase family 3 protein [Rugosimonospora africana]|uniref:beta-glucosidase n=1 Tax=Rugosimonospora africana TaxID=556532 RepID=A0A8J3VTE9_9ACTN|nr:glycoside hydrolase family 3 N-terminal domain-containing protein [Rugosimonospora africana]GIH18009.1 beta-glucosidase [Rugosimonospora africana]
MSSAPNPPYRDPGLSVARRTEDLLGRMTLQEKAGLLFHTMIVMGPGGTLAPADPHAGLLSARDMVVGLGMSHFNLIGSAPARQMARWHNRVQDLAAGTRLGIPVTLSTDPRHACSDNPNTAVMAGPFSQWPEPLGLAATRDAALVERFADTVRQEYLAVGLRLALHPQVDLATEPRWPRVVGTFGADADLACVLVRAYLRGLRAATLGPDGVAAMTKHFPGGGPQKDGEDPHFRYAREQVYPGGRFDEHLAPFAAAVAAGTSQLMPYYGMPVGTRYEQVGFGFNRDVITGLLRERLGFDGIVCTDWGVLTDAEFEGQVRPARAWGVEHLTPHERARKALEAGVDQFGGEARPDLVVDLVRTGQVSEHRLDASVRRLLREKFRLGLFDSRYVDEDRAACTVGRADLRAAGLAAQHASATLLTNAGRDSAAHLPLRPGLRVYCENLAPGTLASTATVVDDPARAEVAILRLAAPYEPRPGPIESYFHAGGLEYPPGELARIRAITDTVPSIVDIYLDRPAVLTPLAADAATLLVTFGIGDGALVDVLTGRAAPGGRLPFDLPGSAEDVGSGRPDVPFDAPEPLFRYGHGLTW